MKAALALALCLYLAPGALAQAPDAGQFDVRFHSERIGEGPEDSFSGDLFIAFANRGEPRMAMHAWVDAPPVMRFSVQGVVRGQSVRVGLADATRWHPANLGEQKGKEWQVQAVLRMSQTGRSAGMSQGDLFSKPAKITFEPGSDGVCELVLDQVAQERELKETARIKHFEFESPSPF